MNNSKKYVLIVAGEASGDTHGANLVKALTRLSPDLQVKGIGGKHMAEAGVEIIVSASDMAVVGLTEVLTHLHIIIQAHRKLKLLLKYNRPNLLILIDYPEFNISLARLAKRYGVPVLYYISPQVWAWRQARVKKIARRVDRMAVILPFEKDFYNKRGMIVDFVGHPLLDSIPSLNDKKIMLRELGLKKQYPIIGLLPGSRNEEVSGLLPLMIDAIDILSPHYRNIQCILPLASTISPDLIQRILQKSSIPVTVSQKNIYGILSVCDIALVTSGTATLETAVMNVPMVIIYKVSPISYWIGKRVIQVPHVGLPNLVAGKMIVPELIQAEVTPHRIAQETQDILNDDQRKTHIIEQLQMVTEKLGTGGASEKTARIAIEMMR
ncbi:MAG: lipid-A-disaccharide synthase [Deltaproteobacteria bacterium]|nr:lipid-A-disaccharide synthase [Deltaproteobacteria bacterium]